MAKKVKFQDSIQNLNRKSTFGETYGYVKKINIDLIKTDGGTQPRSTLNDDTIDEYANRMIEGDKFPPVIVYFDGVNYWLADGFHRFEAYKKNNENAIDCEVIQGNLRDAILFSVGANYSHGLRRTQKDKRKAVETLLRDEEWSKWADREIGRQCKVDHKTVSKIRNDLSGEIPQTEERLVERKGVKYSQNTKNIGKNQKQKSNKFRLSVTLSNDEKEKFATIKAKAKKSNKELLEEAFDYLFKKYN